MGEGVNQGQTIREKLPTPVIVERLAELLIGYPNDRYEYIIDGFTNGFRIGFEGIRSPQSCSNLRSANQHPEIVTAKLGKELAEGRIEGPFEEVPFENLKLSPLGLVEKKTPGEYRLIHHLSYPRGSGTSVNANIPSECSAVSYAGIDDAISLVKKLGRGCFIAKTDLRNAFRLVPVHPSDYELLGFTWQGKFYFDRCLSMGGSSSCRIFEAVSCALQWIAEQKFGSLSCSMVHILDDFCFVGSNYETCLEALLQFLKLCAYLGFPIAQDKTFFPRTSMDFVGITLDSCLMEARLPKEKIQKCLQMLIMFMDKKSCKLRELQSLLGYLNFCSLIVVSGRAFLRRLYNLTMGLEQPYYYIRLDKEAKKDLQTWYKFIQQFNGKSMFISDRLVSSIALHLYTDAAKSLGYGAIYGSSWLYGLFPREWQSLNITFLELYPIVLAVHIWGHLWENHSIIFHTDNEGLVSILNSKTSRDTDIMCLVRALVLECMKHNILFRSMFVRGSDNTLADCLSRQQVEKFKALSPNSNPQPTAVPPSLEPVEFWRVLTSC